jgi:hypothetical protein
MSEAVSASENLANIPSAAAHSDCTVVSPTDSNVVVSAEDITRDTSVVAMSTEATVTDPSVLKTITKSKKYSLSHLNNTHFCK